MRRRIFVPLMLWVFLSLTITNGEERGIMNQEVSLPSEVSEWKWDGKEMTYDSKALFGYMNGTAELYLAYGFRSMMLRRFEKPPHPPLTIELYEMASPEDAYGVFSFERQDDAAGIGQGSEFGGGMLRFWKGKYFVSVYCEGEGTEVETAILKAGKAVSDSISIMGKEPEIIGLIPGREFGLVDKSVRYLRSHVLLNQRFFIAHQNILKLGRQTEAAIAQYLLDKQKVQLLLIRYPNAKEARDAYQSFVKAYLPDAPGRDRLKTEDRKWTIARHRNEHVLIIFGSPTEAGGEALLKAAEQKLPKQSKQ